MGRDQRRFAGVRALVTGGSSGIGLETACRLASEGADLALVARDAGRLASAVARLESQRARPDQRFEALPADLRDSVQVARLASEAEQRLGGVDLLVNNAGVARPGRIVELEDAVFVDALETNYLGAVRLTRAVLPGMLERRRGHIAFVSSLAGALGVYGYGAYGASKFAVTGFAEVLRQELAPHGLGVTILFPPDTDTPQLAAEEPYKPGETRALAGSIAPLTPQRVAAALVDGIASRRFHVFPDRRTQFVLLAQRLAPGLLRRLVDRTIRRL